jgi:hypothetical protein
VKAGRRKEEGGRRKEEIRGLKWKGIRQLGREPQVNEHDRK